MTVSACSYIAIRVALVDSRWRSEPQPYHVHQVPRSATELPLGERFWTLTQSCCFQLLGNPDASDREVTWSCYCGNSCSRVQREQLCPCLLMAECAVTSAQTLQLLFKGIADTDWKGIVCLLALWHNNDVTVYHKVDRTAVLYHVQHSGQILHEILQYIFSGCTHYLSTDVSMCQLSCGQLVHL